MDEPSAITRSQEELSEMTHSLHNIFSKIFPSDNSMDEGDRDPYFTQIIKTVGCLKITDIIQVTLPALADTVRSLFGFDIRRHNLF